MKPSELRIGNLIRDNLTHCLLSVEYISTQSFSAMVVDRSKFPLPYGWQAEPIPLTGQWLLDFGYEKDDYSSWGGWLSPRFGNGSQRRIRLMKEGIFIILEAEVKYVHQLQNLYFALTGEELTKK